MCDQQLVVDHVDMTDPKVLMCSCSVAPEEVTKFSKAGTVVLLNALAAC